MEGGGSHTPLPTPHPLPARGEGQEGGQGVFGTFSLPSPHNPGKAALPQQR